MGVRNESHANAARKAVARKAANYRTCADADLRVRALILLRPAASGGRPPEVRSGDRARRTDATARRAHPLCMLRAPRDAPSRLERPLTSAYLSSAQSEWALATLSVWFSARATNTIFRSNGSLCCQWARLGFALLARASDLPQTRLRAEEINSRNESFAAPPLVCRPLVLAFAFARLRVSAAQLVS